MKKIQQALTKAGFAVTADGVYGQKTADAVRMFQRSVGIVQDGMVGPVTMGKLTDTAAGTDKNTQIVAGYINKHITFCKGRPLKYIAIHYTAGGNSRKGAAMAARNVFLTRSASADFVVDDEQIVQVNPDIRNYYCWAVGDRKNIYSGGARLYGYANNKNTISIEICSNLQAGTSAAQPNHEGWFFTEDAVGNALKLVRYLMQAYGIPKSNIIRHYDISGKLCPGIIGWNNAPLYTRNGVPTTTKNNSQKWLEFLDSI